MSALDAEASLAHGYTRRLEAGRIPSPGIAHLRKIADALGVPLVELLTFPEDTLLNSAVENDPALAAIDEDLKDLVRTLLAIKVLSPQRIDAVRATLKDTQRLAEIERDSGA